MSPILGIMLKRAVNVLASGILGALVATVGAGAHRAAGYLGIGLVLALVASAAIFAKTWASWAGFIAFASVWAAATMFYGGKGPGDSVLVSADLKGQLLIYGGAVLIAVTAAVPRFVLVGRDVSS